MNITDLTKLSPEQLRVVSKKNHTLFLLLTPLDLGFFYYSLFMENWISMFLALGLFIASLAIYDNYKVTRMLWEAENSTF